jgi:acetate kinase
VDEVVAATSSSVRVLVVHTHEEWQIMRECYRLSKTAG